MPSSTSSFRGELKILAMIVGVLAVCEIAVRLFAVRFSGDLRQTYALPATADRLAAAKGRRVLVVGNSLTVYGFDAKAFGEAYAARTGGDAHVEVEAFRGSETCEWYYLFRRFFAAPGKVPQLLILPLNVESVRDLPRVEIGRLVYFCDGSDVPDVLRRDLHGFGDRAEFLHAYTFASFANREKVRKTAFDMIIPRHQAGERKIHVARLAARRAGKRPAFTYDRLIRLIRLAAEHNVTVLGVAMPSQSGYELDPVLLKTLAAEKASFVDLRDAPGLTRAHFRDPVHLNEQGAALVTQTLVERLPESVVAPSSTD